MSAPASERPLWLLDIDGVVNALARGPLPVAWPEHDWVQRLVVTEIPGRGVMTLPILAARPVLDFIADVHRSGSAEVRWHSTWRTAAITSFAPALGLPTTITMSVAPEWNDRPVAQWWKLGAAERAVAAGRTPGVDRRRPARLPHETERVAACGQPAHRTVQRHRSHPRRPAADRGVPALSAGLAAPRQEPRSTYEQAFDGCRTKFSRCGVPGVTADLRVCGCQPSFATMSRQRVGPLVQPQRVRPVGTRRQGVLAAEAVDLHGRAGDRSQPSRHTPGRTPCRRSCPTPPAARP